MESAVRHEEVGLVAHRDQEPHLAFDGDGEQARVEQCREEPAALLVELDRADEVYLQLQDRIAVVARDGEPQDTENRNVAGYLDDDAELETHERGRAPAE